MKRTVLFLITNFAVLLVFGFVLSLFGVRGESMSGLLIFALLFGFGGSFISLLMSKSMALRSVGGVIIKEPSNATERWLIGVVARQAEQAGIAMPDVALYEAPDMNAFATGARRNASLVAVSTGLLNNMTQDEAEAVLAHEISHIANGDMITMTLLQGILNTFVIFLSRIVAQLVASFMSGNRNGESRGVGMLYYPIVMVLEILFGVLASIIAMWFSRHREYRADAGSANLVGREKMVAALQKLKRSHEPEEGSELMAFCINGNKKSKFGQLFLSHPPLDERINALQNLPYDDFK